MVTAPRFCWTLFIAAALVACATPAPVGRRDLLDFVAAGTPRTEFLLKLGPPFAVFDGERVMTWSIGQDAAGYVIDAARYVPGAPRSFARYELVVVFDADGRASKHSLVEVRKP